MPQCVTCGEKLVCPDQQKHSSEPGGIHQACALKKGAVWVHVIDTGGNPVPGVDVVLDGLAQPTGKDGFVDFGTRDPNEYEASLAQLSETMAANYDLTERTTEKFKLSGGEFAYIAFKLARKSLLTVKVRRTDGEKLKSPANVRVLGKGDEGPFTTVDGVATCGMRSANNYTVKVELDSPDTDTLYVGDDKAVTIASGRDEEVTVEVRPKNVVTPKVEITKAIGWIDDQIAPAQLQLSITESVADPAYTGLGRLVVLQGGVKLYDDEQCGQEVTSFTAEDLRNQGKPLYIKSQDGNPVASARIQLALDPTNDPRFDIRGPDDKAVEIKRVTVVTPKISTPEGKAILVNKKLKDLQTGPEVKVAPSQRTCIEIFFTESTGAPAYDKTGTLDLPNHVKAYDDAEGGNPIDLTTPLSAAQLRSKKTLYLEGESGGACEVKLTLVASDNPAIRTIREAKETMFAVKLDLEVYKIERTNPWAEVALTETQKIADGRVVHVQYAAQYSRAKIVVKKPSTDLWTIGGDGYKLKLEISKTSGAAALFTADSGGGGSASIEITKADFNAGDKAIWLEGSDAVTTLRGVRTTLGLSGTAEKQHGDWAAFTVVKIASVSPTTGVHSQYVREIPVDPQHPLDRGPKYEAEAQLTTALAGIDIFYTVVAAAGAQNAVYPNIPIEWMPENPVLPVSKPTDAQGAAKELVTLSKEKNGLHGYHKNKYQVGAYLADDPVKGLANPIKGLPIEIEAPARKCACCNRAGHSAGVPIDATEWYEQADFSNPPTFRPKRTAYQNGIANVNNRAAGGCTCPSALALSNPPPALEGPVTWDLLPRGGNCATFFAPVTAAEHSAIETNWKKEKKKATGYPTRKGIIDPPYTNQMDRQINHLVPKSAGGCATGPGNLQPNGWLCTYCQTLDAPFSKWQDKRKEK